MSLIELCTLPRLSGGPFLLVFVLLFCPLGSAQGEYHHVSGCEVCHDFHSYGGTNLYLIGEVIQTPNSGPKPVIDRTTLGELIDRVQFYNSFKIITPQQQMQIDQRINLRAAFEGLKADSSELL